MKKDELEKLCEDLRQQLRESRDRISKLHEQIESERENFRKSLDEVRESFEEKQYQEWLKQNGKFVERYFGELVNKHLSISTSCDYGGEIETVLCYDETIVSTSSDTVINHHNPFDE